MVEAQRRGIPMRVNHFTAGASSSAHSTDKSIGATTRVAACNAAAPAIIAMTINACVDLRCRLNLSRRQSCSVRICGADPVETPFRSLNKYRKCAVTLLLPDSQGAR